MATSERSTDKDRKLYELSGELRKLSEAMLMIAQLAPHRMTLSQAVFFLATATAITSGETATYTNIKEKIGPEVNRSLAQTYRVLFETSRLYPNALGWLERKTNPRDNREKLFSLTRRGREVLHELARELS